MVILSNSQISLSGIISHVWCELAMIMIVRFYVAWMKQPMTLSSGIRSAYIFSHYTYQHARLYNTLTAVVHVANLTINLLD